MPKVSEDRKQEHSFNGKDASRHVSSYECISDLAEYVQTRAYILVQETSTKKVSKQGNGITIIYNQGRCSEG